MHTLFSSNAKAHPPVAAIGPVASMLDDGLGCTVRLVVEPAERGQRLDHFLARRLPERSREFLKRLITNGQVAVSRHARARPALRLDGGVEVTVEVPPAPRSELRSWDAPVRVLVDDPAFVVVDKPAGLVVHPGAGNRERTLVHALLHRYPEMAAVGGLARPGIVHRLDKGTSGAMVVARTASAYDDLVRQFSRHLVTKIYLAVVAGSPSPSAGTIDRPIGRDTRNRQRFSVGSRRGRPARSHYRLRAAGHGASLLQVRIETGRTHQIRVHLAALGHPLLGDPLYGRGGRRLSTNVANLAAARDGAFLHAWKLAFAHPVSGDPVSVMADVPTDFEQLWDAIRDGD